MSAVVGDLFPCGRRDLRGFYSRAFASFAVAFSFGFSALAGVVSAQSNAKDAGGFALVELFSSEGCSSCPPADDVVASVARDAAAKGERVYALAFHVDYWDYIGWPDRFATAEFTARQRDYQRIFNSKSIYTPQIVLNGKTEFLGSDRARANTEIASALKGRLGLPPVPADVTTARSAPLPGVANSLAAQSDASNSASQNAVSKSSRASAMTMAEITLETTIQDRTINAKIALSPGPPADSQLVIHIALVENGLVSEVKRGENAGKTLHHDRVVRGFATLSQPFSATTYWNMKAGKDIVLDHASLVVWMQDMKTGEVFAVSERALNSRPAKAGK